MIRNFPQLCLLECELQPYRAIISAVNGNIGRGCSQVGREGNQKVCGGWWNFNGGWGNSQLGKEVAHVDDKAQC